MDNVVMGTSPERQRESGAAKPFSMRAKKQNGQRGRLRFDVFRVREKAHEVLLKGRPISGTFFVKHHVNVVFFGGGVISAVSRVKQSLLGKDHQP
ncbi:hypothetical protein QC823_13000 [Halomonas vilamensis]|uniref:Uncharacterized protein n=1 Tax=Vreelandella vilamensis TaxID=531309 RepID=A0ABU1H6J0_9GAMM|nr:hypothetical protein [Halomonas vilamensis]MDR5899906.1 hypothetical protein [Halomonas vilamensis]